MGRPACGCKAAGVPESRIVGVMTGKPESCPLGRVRAFADRVLAAWNATLPGVTLHRYLARRGPLLANGLAFGLLFAFFAGVWTIASILGLVVTGSTELRARLVESLERIVPGIADGVLSASGLSGVTLTLTWTGILTLLMFWWTVVGWMDSLRDAVGALAGMGDDADVVRTKLRDSLAVVLVAVLLLLSTIAAAVSAGAVRAVLGFLGVQDGSTAMSTVVDVAGGVVGLALNAALLLVMFRVVCRIRRGMPLLLGCLLGGLAVSGMQLLGTRLLTGASRNPLLAPFAAIVGVLIWFNLLSQVILVCAAFVAELEARTANEDSDASVSDASVSDGPVSDGSAG